MEKDFEKKFKDLRLRRRECEKKGKKKDIKGSGREVGKDKKFRWWIYRIIEGIWINLNKNSGIY